MPEKSEFDKALGELHDLTGMGGRRGGHTGAPRTGAGNREALPQQQDSPGELQALVLVSNCLEREFVHRQLATGQPLHTNL